MLNATEGRIALLGSLGRKKATSVHAADRAQKRQCAQRRLQRRCNSGHSRKSSERNHLSMQGMEESKVHATKTCQKKKARSFYVPWLRARMHALRLQSETGSLQTATKAAAPSRAPQLALSLHTASEPKFGSARRYACRESGVGTCMLPQGPLQTYADACPLAMLDLAPLHRCPCLGLFGRSVLPLLAPSLTP